MPAANPLQRVGAEAWAAGRWAELAEAVLRSGDLEALGALLELEVRDDDAVLLDEHLPSLGRLPDSPWRRTAYALIALRTGHDEQALLDALEQLRGEAPRTAAAIAVAMVWRLADLALWDAAARFDRLLDAEAGSAEWFDATGARALAGWHTAQSLEHFELLREALAGPRQQHRLDRGHALALVATGRVFAGLGDWNRAGNDLAQAVRLIPQRAASRLAATKAELALARYRHGDWHGAALEARSVERMLGDASALTMRSIRSSMRALQPVLAGERRLAEQRILEARAALTERRSLVAETALLHARLLLAISADDGQVLLQLIESEDQPGYRRLYSRHEWLCLHALALRLSGSDARLRQLIADWSGEPGAAESAYYWSHEALLRMLDGDTTAVDAAERMLAGVRSTDDPLGRAWVRYVHGLVETHLGDTETGIASLETARSALLGFGAHELVANCDEAITAARMRSSAVPDALRPLTAQQRTIALLVADGRTSAQIAEQLFLSKRTVDYHVANVLDRLGLRGRHEIAALLR